MCLLGTKLPCGVPVGGVVGTKRYPNVPGGGKKCLLGTKLPCGVPVGGFVGTKRYPNVPGGGKGSAGVFFG